MSPAKAKRAAPRLRRSSGAHRHADEHGRHRNPKPVMYVPLPVNRPGDAWVRMRQTAKRPAGVRCGECEQRVYRSQRLERWLANHPWANLLLLLAFVATCGVLMI